MVRWSAANDEFAPDEFIPLARGDGVIREVTHFALRTADDGHDPLGARTASRCAVAVNVSAARSSRRTDFAEEARLASRRGGSAGVAAGARGYRERAASGSPAEAIRTLDDIARAGGFRLSVDDYGPASRLCRTSSICPVHELKIDKSFVTTLTNSKSDAIMVRSTINLAHELGLQVVAEGIEDGNDVDLLREQGCDYAQGYFISKPLRFERVLRVGHERGRCPPSGIGVGEPCWIRTSDLLIKSQLLYRLS